MGSPDGESQGSNSTRESPFQFRPNLTRSPTVNQLCQPSQKPPPFGGPVSVGEQICSRTGSKSKIPGVLQPAKPNNWWRPILDLRILNTFLNSESFKIETTETIKTSLQAREWLSSIDFQDAYFHIPIHNQSRKYMHFHFWGRSYQFKALPFGLSTAPIKFSRQSTLAKLHENLIPILRVDYSCI